MKNKEYTKFDLSQSFEKKDSQKGEYNMQNFDLKNRYYFDIVSTSDFETVITYGL